MPTPPKGPRACHAAGRAARRCPTPLRRRWPTLVTRRVRLASERLGLIAEIDVLMLADGAAVPLDHKKGQPAACRRRRLSAGAGANRHAGRAAARAGLHLRRRRAVVCGAAASACRCRLTEELIATALGAASELRLAAAARRIPPPLDNSPKCTRCSLLPICLPDEVNLFRTGAVPRTPPPPADAALPLLRADPRCAH